MGSRKSSIDTEKPGVKESDARSLDNDNRLVLAQSMWDEELLDTEKKLKRKLDLRLLVCVWVIFVMNYLDRNNIAAAKVAGIATSLNLSAHEYATAVAILFVGYVLMQLPSNIFLAQFRPSLYLPACMALCGLISTLTGVVQNGAGLYAARFFLGFVEAAFYHT